MKKKNKNEIKIKKTKIKLSEQKTNSITAVGCQEHTEYNTQTDT